MDTTKTGGPAFPIADPFALRPRDEAELERIASGMTLRDWFAGQALVATYLNGFAGPSDDQRAATAYRMADAMLRTREVSQ
ncbi:hypothetical protein [Burkholderia multivorans]|uniref:Bacteriophage protein n=1 Tax=Burkholderia multivorans (strain ATCC 17616 / 249) TaxID=395019 RepID=A0A0H3KMW8_BURM1|nr:hypothetical protein [Burkholderia multivorans]ABX15536.1 GP38 [Burkholderia multivorans ATCC 17616]PRF51356.1 hypothetical protein C6Q28_29445 [Burkholderia multivorans]BAG43329.1 putative bacteriophage protein [Burkholderia multivorans ATCC 17616]